MQRILQRFYSVALKMLDVFNEKKIYDSQCNYGEIKLLP